MIWHMARSPREEASVQDHGSIVVLIGLQWLGLAVNFFAAWLFPAAAIPWQRTGVFLVGVVVILIGVAFRWYAIGVLGNYFTRKVVVSANQPVLQHGPYRFIRHPTYSGTLLTMLGVGLATTNWIGLVVLLLLTFTGHLYRVHVEEKALIQAIGQPYTLYMQRSKRFIPGVF
jgi:protein-S-isoprenylcysteine O-methyltransferase Ste14